jgi:hypothetical protein
VFDLAQNIHRLTVTGELVRVRMVLLTDGICRHDLPKDQDLSGYVATFDVWDIERLYKFESSGRQQEAIAIDLTEIVGEPIPCLKQPGDNLEYDCYLSIFPGSVLAHLYGKYSARLLERNIRSFLQAKGGINRGIRQTILKEPEMFLAYNNGLSATAEEAEIVTLNGGGIGIARLRGLQVVNGGQKTASIFHVSKKDKADVSKVSVQVKLTILRDEAKADEVVPLIAEYANSQNKIQAADLKANGVYQRGVEALSRTVYAPAPAGSQRMTRWFYERARGQYQDALNVLGTKAKQDAFVREHPKNQLFTKTDLAKFVLTADQKPWIVSKGAQACFAAFIADQEKHLEREGVKEDALNADYFERLAARAILFRGAEIAIKQQKQLYSGYWANLVTYSIARLMYETDGRVDFYRLWKEQKLWPELEQALLDLANSVWVWINARPDGGNVTQYCKRKECWDGFLTQDVFTSGGFAQFKVAPVVGQGAGAAAHAYAVQELRDRLAPITSADWFALAEWIRTTHKLNALRSMQATTFATLVGTAQALTPAKVREACKLLDDAKQAGYTAI